MLKVIRSNAVGNEPTANRESVGIKLSRIYIICLQPGQDNIRDDAIKKAFVLIDTERPQTGDAKSVFLSLSYKEYPARVMNPGDCYRPHDATHLESYHQSRGYQLLPQDEPLRQNVPSLDNILCGCIQCDFHIKFSEMWTGSYRQQHVT